jgi:hypothetical protein
MGNRNGGLSFIDFGDTSKGVCFIKMLYDLDSMDDVLKKIIDKKTLVLVYPQEYIQENIRLLVNISSLKN